MSGSGHTDGVVYGVVVTFLGIPVIFAYTTAVNGIETVVVYAVLGSISGGVIWCWEVQAYRVPVGFGRSMVSDGWYSMDREVDVYVDALTE